MLSTNVLRPRALVLSRSLCRSVFLSHSLSVFAVSRSLSLPFLLLPASSLSLSTPALLYFLLHLIYISPPSPLPVSLLTPPPGPHPYRLLPLLFSRRVRTTATCSIAMERLFTGWAIRNGPALIRQSATTCPTTRTKPFRPCLRVRGRQRPARTTDGRYVEDNTVNHHCLYYAFRRHSCDPGSAGLHCY